MKTELMKNPYVSAICEKLKQDDFKFKEEKFDYLDVIVAAGQQFKMSWFKTTQINIFTIIGIVEAISQEFIEAYSKMTLGYTMKNYKVLPKQMHSLTTSFPLLISSHIDEDARNWIQQRPKSKLGFLELPVILDTGKNTILICDESFRKSGNYKFLTNLVYKYFNPDKT